MFSHHNQKQVHYPKKNIEINRVSQLMFRAYSECRPKMKKNHIDNIFMKISKIIGIMYRLKDIYHQNILLTLYNSLIVPHLNYCILTWGSKFFNCHKKLILQKEALMIITDSNYIAHSEPICKASLSQSY